MGGMAAGTDPLAAEEKWAAIARGPNSEWIMILLNEDYDEDYENFEDWEDYDHEVCVQQE